MSHLSVMCVGVLASGCSLVSSLDGYTFQAHLDGGFRADAAQDGGVSSDADTPVDGGRRVRDASPDSGPGGCPPCGDERPLCDEARMRCVQCLSSSDCASGTCNDGSCATVTDFHAALFHNCAVLEDGTVWCWGRNDYGQIGDGTAGTNRTVPTRVPGIVDASSITGGAHFTCVATTGGEVRCWGANRFEHMHERTHVLGSSEPEYSPTPVPITTASGVASLSGGNEFACFIPGSGQVTCWGANFGGQLGDGTFADRGTPAPVQHAGSPFTANQVDGGGGHACARRSDNSVWCWGANFTGALGTGDTADATTPRRVAGIPAVLEVASAGLHTCAAAADGIYCWGNNPNGQLGDGTTEMRTSPVLALAGPQWRHVAVGSEWSCAWTDAGAARCWGDNNRGALGDGSFAGPGPVDVMLTDVARLSAGELHTCAQRSDESLWCWGSNDFGQIGDGTVLVDRPAPTRVVWPE